MAMVFHRTWAASAIPILFHGGFKDNSSGFTWVANMPLQPYSFGNVLSDNAATAGGDCVIRIDIESTVLEGCVKQQKPGLIYYQVPSEKLNACKLDLIATSYRGKMREELVASMEEVKADLAARRKPPFIGWDTVERWERAIALFDKVARLP